MTRPSLRLHILGAGLDVGRSCLHASTPSSSFLLDCGAHPGYADKRRFPDFRSICDQRTIQDADANSIATLDAVLITHFHIDHVAALPLLTETLQCPAPVYMTEPTRELAMLMLADFVATSKTRNQYCPFGMEDVRKCLGKVRLLKLGTTEKIGNTASLHVTPYYAGHVLGAVMLHVVIDGISILYSGDYSIRSDRHLRGASVPFGLRPDLFITETTYCSTVRKCGRASQENELMERVTNAVAKGGKVLVPISAFGKVQAVCAVFAAHPDADVLAGVPMYVVSGLTSKANKVYEGFDDWTADNGRGLCLNSDYDTETVDGRPRKRARTACPFLTRLRPFNRNEHSKLLDAPGPMILFATPGNMSTGLSRDVFKRWATDDRNVVVVPGFNISNTMASKLLSGNAAPDEDIQKVKCRIVNLTYNAHADARGIVRTCRQVRPHAIMLVHGERTKVLNFQTQVRDKLNLECYAPHNGDIITIPSARQAPATITSDQILESLSTEWCSVVDTYIKKASNFSSEGST